MMMMILIVMQHLASDCIRIPILQMRKLKIRESDSPRATKLVSEQDSKPQPWSSSSCALFPSPHATHKYFLSVWGKPNTPAGLGDGVGEHSRATERGRMDRNLNLGLTTNHQGFHASYFTSLGPRCLLWKAGIILVPTEQIRKCRCSPVSWGLPAPLRSPQDQCEAPRWGPETRPRISAEPSGWGRGSGPCLCCHLSPRHPAVT